MRDRSLVIEQVGKHEFASIIACINGRDRVHSFGHLLVLNTGRLLGSGALPAFRNLAESRNLRVLCGFFLLAPFFGRALIPTRLWFISLGIFEHVGNTAALAGWIGNDGVG